MRRVVVAGIAVLDTVHRVERLPSGGSKSKSTDLHQIGGGCAANAAVAIARLGGEAVLMTRLGDDAAGRLLAERLQAAGVSLAATTITAGAQTPQSAVMVDRTGERMIVNFPGAGLATASPPPGVFDAALADTRWPEAGLAILRAARDTGRPGVLDGEAPVPDDLAAMASHTVFSAPGLRDFGGQADLDAALAATDLPGETGYTDGEVGVVWRSGLRVPPPEVAAVDTLGAGDVWHGAFALALARGEALEEASAFANAAAALKCTRAGGWDVYPTAPDLDDSKLEIP